MNLREAAQQALEALENDPVLENANNNVMAWLRAALADTQDWDEIEALRASLREHMAEIHRLRVAGRQALDAMDYTRWAVADQTPNEDVAAHDEAMNKLRAALAEEKNENTVQSTGGVHSRVSDGANRGVEAVTDCHEKAADHIPDDTKMMASVRESRTVGATIKDTLTVEPVAWMYPEGLAALKTGKCWVAYGTKQDDNNIPIYDAVAPRVEPRASESGGGFESLPASLTTQEPAQEPVKFKCTVVDDAHPEGVPLSQWGRQPEQRPFCYHDGRNIVGKEYADHSDVFPLYTSPNPEQRKPVRFNCTVIDDAHLNGVPLSQWGKQHEMQPCAGRNCGSTNPNLHSAECFEDYEKATWMNQRKPLTDDRVWLEYMQLWPFRPNEEPTLAKDILRFARAIEAAHGITGESK